MGDSSIETKTLINLVKQHKVLWDYRSKQVSNYRDRFIIAWNQISEQSGGIHVDILKKKWKGLRDTYFREVKKSNADKDYKSMWSNFPLMCFLQDSSINNDDDHNATFDDESSGFNEKDSTELDATDVEKLINLVHEHKCLWDRTDPVFGTSRFRQDAWEEISEELEMPVSNVRKKWKELQDNFITEIKKIDSQDLDETHYSKIPYFNLLSFLRDSITNDDPANEAFDDESFRLYDRDLVVDLINQVREHQCLWDKNYPGYTSNAHRLEAWQEISEELKIPANVIKNKWRNLRTSYLRNLTKDNGKYLYCNHMSFIRNTKDNKKPKKRKSNQLEYIDVKLIKTENIKEESEHYEDEEVEEETVDGSDDDEKDEEQVVKKISSKDPDVMFLMSLAPYMKELPKHRKLVVRSQLLDVFIKEQNSA